MSRKPLERPTFALGDFVFAKLHGYRPWPARILGRHGSHSNLKYSVFFYGTCNTAKVSPVHILDFEQNKQRLGILRPKNSARNVEFRGAMAHIRQAFKRPANDFVYYQVLARTEGEGESCVTYEMLTSTTETDSNETDSGDSSEMPETYKPKATEQESEEEDKTRETEITSERDEEPQPAKKPKISKPLLDKDEDDQNHTLKTMEKELKPLGGDTDLFSESDSDSFELEGNPIVRSTPLKDFHEQDHSVPISLTMEEMIRQLNEDSDSDDDSENDQPINLCCRHITGDEQ